TGCQRPFVKKRANPSKKIEARPLPYPQESGESREVCPFRKPSLGTARWFEKRWMQEGSGNAREGGGAGKDHHAAGRPVAPQGPSDQMIPGNKADPGIAAVFRVVPIISQNEVGALGNG